MKYNLVIATHHKTGTVWMDGVFRSIAADLGARFIDYKSEAARLDERLNEPFVLFNHDSDFRSHPGLLERPDVRILHVIRDPRDVLISAMHYHKRARETWLHQPAPRYRGTTYQDALRKRRTKFDQYVFEMENSTGCTLDDMRQWHYRRANCFEARYEDLRQDSGLVHWRRIMDFLGLDEQQRARASRCFWQNSLFGGLPRLGNSHVRSGAVAQWRREFTLRLGYAFLSRFPGLLQRLGYERDTRWLLDLPQADSLGLAAQLGVAAAASWALLLHFSRTAPEF
jgi:hypothetical protein